jgi:hypothetical protein
VRCSHSHLFSGGVLPVVVHRRLSRVQISPAPPPPPGGPRLYIPPSLSDWWMSSAARVAPRRISLLQGNWSTSRSSNIEKSLSARGNKQDGIPRRSSVNRRSTTGVMTTDEVTVEVMVMNQVTTSLDRASMCRAQLPRPRTQRSRPSRFLGALSPPDRRRTRNIPS